MSSIAVSSALPVLSPLAPNDVVGTATQLQAHGCAILPTVFSATEVAQILRIIETAEAKSDNFRRHA
jgi:hypothetical protein